MNRLSRVQTVTFRIPIATPVRTAFGTMTERVGVFVRAEDDAGAHGWGEIWCNFPSASAEHRAAMLDQIIAPRLLGRDISDPAALWAETDAALHLLRIQCGDQGALSAALAGLDLALHDLRARRLGLPLWRALGGTEGAAVPAYASGINPGPGALAAVQGARQSGYRAFKIKIGFGHQADLDTLDPVAAGLLPGELLMVDANQGLDVRAACDLARDLRRFPLAWIEEPLPADRPLHEWSQVAAAAGTVLAAGENLRGLAEFQSAIASGCFGVIQPDAAKWGGASACLQVARGALLGGRSYCPHFLGGAIGLMHSLHLLAAVRGPGLLEVDVNPNPLREAMLDGALALADGAAVLPPGSGLGFEPDFTPIERYRTLTTERSQAPPPSGLAGRGRPQ
jgi:L-alanine-DL-glutamate epimerase-like enolase superfamily enzyme